jgi:DNA-directed RNA polymerase subunit alpha
MLDKNNIALPSKPKVVIEENNKGIYEIDGLYPGYGHTLGNSLRRIILSSLPGAAITELKIKGVGHEFSTIKGVKEDVISIILNIKKIRASLFSDEPQILKLKVSGPKTVKTSDIVCPSQVEIQNKDLILFTITDKTEIDFEMTIKKGLGYVPKELIQKDRVEVGTISLDGNFTPIRRVNYETENMRVGDRTDFNRLRLIIETDGTITPRQALEQSIEIMIVQLKAVVGFKEEVIVEEEEPHYENVEAIKEEKVEEVDEFLKTRIESLNLSARTINALTAANIRTVGGLARKKEEDILDIEGLGSKGLSEIKEILSKNGIELK